nr:hypothetical protein [Tanacetum cinerariifolium]
MKISEVDRVIGLAKPRLILLASILSRRADWARRSDLTRSIASCFCSSVSQRAVSGRSVRVTKATRATPMVKMPSMAKIL